MSGKSIQLPFSVVRDKSKESSTKLNLPPNYRKGVLFKHLPYLGHLENPAIKDVVRDGIVDDFALQKYLLATGLLKDSIQDSWDMIVTNEKFNIVSIRGALNGKYPSIMKKPNPIDVVSNNKTRFDTQNPVIGKLLSQIQSEKNDKAIRKQIEGALSIKDLTTVKRLERLKQFSNNNNNKSNGNDNDIPPAPSPASCLPSPPPYDSSLSINDKESDLEGENLVQNFVLCNRKQQERVAAGEKTAVAAPKKIKFLENLSKLFDDELKDNDDETNYDELLK